VTRDQLASALRRTRNFERFVLRDRVRASIRVHRHVQQVADAILHRRAHGRDSSFPALRAGIKTQRRFPSSEQVVIFERRVRVLRNSKRSDQQRVRGDQLRRRTIHFEGRDRRGDRLVARRLAQEIADHTVQICALALNGAEGE
jgi:hypothetical protein